jgi:hypothetical protein
MDEPQYYTLSVEIGSGQNLVSNHSSELPEFVKIYLLFKLWPSPLRMKSYIPNI